jgi:hypothetical protein
MESPRDQGEFLEHGRFGEGALSLTRQPLNPALARAYRNSVFPHPASAWWIPVLIVVGWVPPFILELFGESRWILAWIVSITLPCTILAVVSVPIQAFRVLMYFINRPKDS